MMFKTVISSPLRRSGSSFTVWRLKPLSLLSFGVQSHHLFLLWRSEALSLLNYDVQSRHIFLATTFSVVLQSLVFRTTICFQFGVQSHHLFSVWRPKPPSFLSYGVQSRHIFSITMFRVVLHSLGFRATISSQFRRSKPPYLFSLVFRATIFSQFWHSKPLFLLNFGI